MAARAEGWAALRDGLGPAWLVVAAASVAGFWTVHEPGAAWTTLLSGRAAGFIALAALAGLWASDWLVRYAREADAVWLRAGMRYAWAVLLALAVPVAWARHLLEPGGAVAVAAAHLGLAGLSAMAAAMLWFHDAATRDAGRRFYLAVAATAAALAVWTAQAGIVGGPTDRSVPLVAWPVAFVLLGAFWLAARLAGQGGRSEGPHGPDERGRGRGGTTARPAAGPRPPVPPAPRPPPTAPPGPTPEPPRGREPAAKASPRTTQPAPARPKKPAEDRPKPPGEADRAGR